MKTTLLMLLFFISVATSVQAQNYPEWFRQKKTQKKYLLQQIVALQVYIEYARKGYKVVGAGLNATSNFTNREFKLHNDYLTSLKMVNPEIKRKARVAGIISVQSKILRDCDRSYSQITGSNAFGHEELQYIRRVFGRLHDDCSKTLDELIAVTTNGKLEMKDEERMVRIDNLYKDMQDKYTFSQSFSNEAKALAAARIKENTEVKASRVLQGIKDQP